MVERKVQRVVGNVLLLVEESKSSMDTIRVEGTWYLQRWMLLKTDDNWLTSDREQNNFFEIFLLKTYLY